MWWRPSELGRLRCATPALQGLLQSQVSHSMMMHVPVLTPWVCSIRKGSIILQPNTRLLGFLLPLVPCEIGDGAFFPVLHTASAHI